MINRLLGHPDRLQSQRCLLLHDLLTRRPQKQKQNVSNARHVLPGFCPSFCSYALESTPSAQLLMPAVPVSARWPKPFVALYIWRWPYCAQIIPGSTCGLFSFLVGCAFHVFTFKLEWLELITVMSWCCINSGWNIPLGRTHCVVFYLREYWSFSFILDAAGVFCFFFNNSNRCPSSIMLIFSSYCYITVTTLSGNVDELRSQKRRLTERFRRSLLMWFQTFKNLHRSRERTGMFDRFANILFQLRCLFFKRGKLFF